jgi:UDP-glucose 4-epimerase
MDGRIFITGAAGALGGVLLRRFGARATGVARQPGPWLQAALPEAGWIDGAPDAAIVHAAGLSVALADGDAQALAAPHLHFAEALVARGWRGRLVLLSSAAVYGEPERLPVPEGAATGPLTVYGRHKLAIETGLSALAARHGFGLAILRLANVYGTGLDLRRRRVAALVLDALARGATFTVYGDGSSQRDYLHADDFAAAVDGTLQAGVGGILNLGSGSGTSLTALIAAAERASGRRLALQREPPRPEPRASVLDIARARDVLGWSPRVGLDEGLARMWRDRP